MVESIYFLKPAWCGDHRAGLWPEQDLQSVIVATAFQAVVFTCVFGGLLRRNRYVEDSVEWRCGNCHDI